MKCNLMQIYTQNIADNCQKKDSVLFSVKQIHHASHTIQAFNMQTTMYRSHT